uniref:ComEC/Rec2 family competence protein n=1 Tax=Roseivirga sp. TaxID=1964215 RepID=UPI0040470FC3
MVVYHYANESLSIHWGWLVAIALAYLFLNFKGSFRFQSQLFFLAFSFLFVAGFLRLQQYRADNQVDHLSKITSEIMAYRAIVVEEPALKAKSINLKVEVIEVLTQEWSSASGKVNVYIDQALGAEIEFGDILLIKGSPSPSEGPKNPGEFDFRNYLVYNNIFHQQFVGEAFHLVGHQVFWWQKPFEYSIKARNTCADLLSAHIKDKDARAVLLAITLGVKDELDNELQASFSAAGAMHVLAVSGLHVGIIYGIILLFFKRVKLNSWKRRWWMAAISILLLWAYAFITGLSPSVLRAVTMFSFVAIAKAKNTNSSIYNTLAASAFVLLCWNPYLIMSVGFQLSYLAVFGIVYLQPRFYRLLDLNNHLLDKIWEISCVSLAAQIATAPLSILYFHQFPTYFLFSNLFVIPAAFAMLILGLLVLTFGSIPYLGDAINWLSEWFVVLVNKLVFGVKQIPGSTIEGIHLTTLETWLVYAAILALILLFATKQLKYLKVSFAFCLAFAISQSQHWEGFKNHQFSVLDVSGEAVMDFRKDNKSQLIADSTFMYDADRIQFHLLPMRQTAGSSLWPKDDQLSLKVNEIDGNRWVVFENKTFLQLKSKKITEVEFTTPIEADFLILSNESINDLEKLVGKIQFGTLIIDKSNRKFLADKLTSQAESLNLKVHSIYRDGFFSKVWNE